MKEVKKIRNLTKTNKTSIMLILVTLFAILISVSAISATPTIGPTVYVNTTGNDTTGDGSAANPFLTVQKGVDLVDTNGTVIIADGVYSGDGNHNINIGRDMTIQGQSQSGTILDGSNTYRLFESIDYSVILKQLTIMNSEHEDGGAIHTHVNLTAIDCTFKNNNAERGGAVFLCEGAATFIRCTFTNNHAIETGGAIFSYGYNSLTVKDSAFTGNTVGPGGYGGAIFIHENQYFEIIGNHFLNNNGSAIYINSGIRETASESPLANIINFNRFYGNTPYGIYYDIEQPSSNSVSSADATSTFDAKYNWWGSNAGPNSAGADKTNLESTYYAPWIVMKLTPKKVVINGGETTLLTASFLYDNNGTYHDPANGHIPDGTPVTFTTSLGQVGSQTITVYTVNGIATATLRAWNAAGDPVSGIAYITATTDAQTLSSNVTIIPVVNAASNTSNTVGMQETGVPFVGLILAILAVFGGLLRSKRK